MVVVEPEVSSATPSTICGVVHIGGAHTAARLPRGNHQRSICRNAYATLLRKRSGVGIVQRPGRHAACVEIDAGWSTRSSEGELDPCATAADIPLERECGPLCSTPAYAG